MAMSARSSNPLVQRLAASHPGGVRGRPLDLPANNAPDTHQTRARSNSAQSTRTVRPAGAYQVIRTRPGPAQIYRFTIPTGVRPGSECTVHAGSRQVRVRCPAGSGPGDTLQISMPSEIRTSRVQLRPAPLTAALGAESGGGAMRMNPQVELANWQSGGDNDSVQTEAVPSSQFFEVTVPQGVRPGQPFQLVADGQKVIVICPLDSRAGQKVQFRLPVSQLIRTIRLTYQSVAGGWKRIIRETDHKFLWQRRSPARDQGHFPKSAYVRKISYMEGNDVRMRAGVVELIPADEAVVDSKLIDKNTTIFSFKDIEKIKGEPVAQKLLWFQRVCKQLAVPWEDGHVEICVRRDQLLRDSVDALMGLDQNDMRKVWNIKFLGEPALDAGGLTKEWFELVTRQVFDPAFGLWTPSANSQGCVEINPASGLASPEDHLIYFRFAGRLLGRALFDGQLVKGRMGQLIHKHLLGLPVSYEDVKSQDVDFFNSLTELAGMEDVSNLYLDFTVTEETMGMHSSKELVEGGKMKVLVNDNRNEYLEAIVRYRMFNRIRHQLAEVLLGFFDVVPEPALAVFDAEELESILCGQPTIDVEDWRTHTKYKGVFKNADHQVVNWFWEIVDEFDQEKRQSLLRFATGSSGVPLRGFAGLRGKNGDISKFTIQGVDSTPSQYPESHTCFNCIDLPCYETKKDLCKNLEVAISTDGFGFE